LIPIRRVFTEETKLSIAALLDIFGQFLLVADNPSCTGSRH